MIDDIIQIAGAGDILYGLSKSGKLYFLNVPTVEEGQPVPDPEWVLATGQNKVKYLPPKVKKLEAMPA